MVDLHWGDFFESIGKPTIKSWLSLDNRKEDAGAKLVTLLEHDGFVGANALTLQQFGVAGGKALHADALEEKFTNHIRGGGEGICTFAAVTDNHSNTYLDGVKARLFEWVLDNNNVKSYTRGDSWKGIPMEIVTDDPDVKDKRVTFLTEDVALQ